MTKLGELCRLIGLEQARLQAVLARLSEADSEFVLSFQGEPVSDLPAALARVQAEGPSLQGSLAVAGVELLALIDPSEESPSRWDLDFVFWVDHAFLGRPLGEQQTRLRALVQLGFELCAVGAGRELVISDEGYRPGSRGGGTTLWSSEGSSAWGAT